MSFLKIIRLREVALDVASPMQNTSVVNAALLSTVADNGKYDAFN